MQVHVKCVCGSKYAFAKEEIGQPFRCPICQQVFNVPAPGEKPILQQPSGKSPVPMEMGGMGMGKPEPPMRPAPLNRPRAQAGSGGCFATLFVMMALVGGLTLISFIGFRSVSVSRGPHSKAFKRVTKKIESLTLQDSSVQQFLDRGFEKTDLGTDGEAHSISGKRLVADKNVRVELDFEDDLAIVAQTAFVGGTLEKNLEFSGQKLTIGKDAVVKGDIQLNAAQTVEILGTVEGQLSGSYQKIVGKANVTGGIKPDEKLMNLLDSEETSGVEND